MIYGFRNFVISTHLVDERGSFPPLFKVNTGEPNAESAAHTPESLDIWEVLAP